MSSNFRLNQDVAIDVTILMGDFNDKCSSCDDDHSTSELGWKLYDLASVNKYNQLINEPTRYVGDNATLLDLILPIVLTFVIIKRKLPSRKF